TTFAIPAMLSRSTLNRAPIPPAATALRRESHAKKARRTAASRLRTRDSVSTPPATVAYEVERMGWDYGATHHARRQRQPESNMRYRYTAAIALLAWVTACIPYTVGSTARPVRVGDHSTTMSTFVMPSFGRLDST